MNSFQLINFYFNRISIQNKNPKNIYVIKKKSETLKASQYLHNVEWHESFYKINKRSTQKIFNSKEYFSRHINHNVNRNSFQIAIRRHQIKNLLCLRKKEKEIKKRKKLYKRKNLQREIFNIIVRSQTLWKCYFNTYVFKFCLLDNVLKMKERNQESEKRLNHKLEWLKLDTSHYDYHEAVKFLCVAK